MKKLLIISCLTIGSLAVAAPTVFEPAVKDMYDLDHYRYYCWGIDMTPFQGATITSAELSFDNITNYNNADNRLYIHLLDNENAAKGLFGKADNGVAFSDAFAGQGVLVADPYWKDTNGSKKTDDVVFTFGSGLLATLNQYVANNGYIAFGIDPDCHYWNDGVKFTVNTAVVPAPGAIFLGSLGVAIVGFLRKRIN